MERNLWIDFNFFFRLNIVVSGMLLRYSFIICFIAITCLVNGQGIVVNPDGTHSVVHGNIVVNPNGTHSVVHGNVVVNANGTHSVLVGFDKPGSTGIIMSPDGKHSVIHFQSAYTGHGLIQVAALHCKLAMIWMTTIMLW